MVIDDLNAFSIRACPAKTDTELVVHADAPLPCAIAPQLLQAISRRGAQVLDAPRQVKLFELAQRRALYIRKARYAPEVEQSLGVGTTEGLNRHN
jgi:hypothetical protein